MVERPRAVTDLWSILEREAHVPFRCVDCIFERFSPRERRRDGGRERASSTMRTADSHSRRAKFAEIVAIVENVDCILILDVAGERYGNRVPAFYQINSRHTTALRSDTVPAPPPQPTPCGAYKFPWATSCRICFSSDSSAISRLSREFSFSSSFTRLACSSLSLPYSLRHR